MRQWLGLGGHLSSPGDAPARALGSSGLHLPRQQQAAQLEVGPVGSASLNPMASTLLEAYLIFWVSGDVWLRVPTLLRLEMWPLRAQSLVRPVFGVRQEIGINCTTPEITYLSDISGKRQMSLSMELVILIILNQDYAKKAFLAKNKVCFSKL